MFEGKASDNHWRLVSPLVCGLTCSLVFFFDAYLIGIGRYFDYIAGLLCLCLIIVDKETRLDFLQIPTFLIFALIYIIAIAVLFGAQPRHFVGLCFVLFCFHMFRVIIKKHEIAIHNSVVAVSVFILTFYVLQMIFGRGWGIFLDINLLLSDLPSRIETAKNYNFRPSSIFQEPNSFCVFAFLTTAYLLLSLKKEGLFQRSIIFALTIAMFASNSLWGIGATLVSLLFCFCLRHFKLFAICLTTILLLSPFLIADNTKERMKGLANDGSFRERYIAAEANFEPVQGLITSSVTVAARKCEAKTAVNYVFGSGLYPDCFQTRYGANGYSYFFDTFGFLGIGLAISLLFYFDRSPFRIKAFTFLFLFSTFPIVTYAFFSLMLALMLRPLDGEVSIVGNK